MIEETFSIYIDTVSGDRYTVENATEEDFEEILALVASGDGVVCFTNNYGTDKCRLVKRYRIPVRSIVAVITCVETYNSDPLSDSEK